MSVSTRVIELCAILPPPVPQQLGRQHSSRRFATVAMAVLTFLLLAVSLLVARSSAADPQTQLQSGSKSTSLAERQAGQLWLEQGSRKWMCYNAKFVESPDADQPWYGRSGFIHPVRTPNGRVVTAAFPADHMHQHGLMFAWTKSRYRGREIDFWNSPLQQAHVEHVSTEVADASRIEVTLQHVVDAKDESTDDAKGESTIVLREQWTLQRIDDVRANVFDLTSTQFCVTEQPLELLEYHYGAMCIRGPSAWLGDQVRITTSAGIERVAGNHTRPSWVAMHGQLDGQACGIAAISHPENFRAPQPVRLHPDKPYFCFAPSVLGAFEIGPDEPYVSRFRFVAFDGPLDAKFLDGLAADFASLPRPQ